MAEFGSSYPEQPKPRWREICISKGTSHEAPPRGGSSIAPSSAGMFIFGGADRNQVAYNDIILCDIPAQGSRIKQSSWRTVDQSKFDGDVPQPRSGHASVAYGKHIFLFGGIDFAEDSTFNDLYVLNVETWKWSYVGEMGAEIENRNSHSLGIIRCKDKVIEGEDGKEEKGECGYTDYIVVFGGASIEKGPLGDTYYAALPKDEAALDDEEFFVTWHELISAGGKVAPMQREMHGTSTLATADNQYASMIITGGRCMETVLDDVWELAPTTTATSGPAGAGAGAGAALEGGEGDATIDTTADVAAAAEEEEEEEAPLAWRRRPDLILDIPRCSHGAGVIRSGDGYLLCLTGGFSGDGLSNEVSYLTFAAEPVPVVVDEVSPALSSSSSSSSPSSSSSSTSSSLSSPMPAVPPNMVWQSAKLASLAGGRFGVATCVAPEWLAHAVLDTADAKYTGDTPMCIFGGINQQADFKDVILLVPPQQQ